MNFKAILVMFFGLLLSGCPARVSSNIKNESSSTIFVLYETGYESEIVSGKSSDENYNFECIRIRKNNMIIGFKTVFPIRNSVEKGIFSSSMKMLYTQENKLLILSLDGVSETYELEKGC